MTKELETQDQQAKQTFQQLAKTFDDAFVVTVLLF